MPAAVPVFVSVCTFVHVSCCRSFELRSPSHEAKTEYRLQLYGYVTCITRMS